MLRNVQKSTGSTTRAAREPAEGSDRENRTPFQLTQRAEQRLKSAARRERNSGLRISVTGSGCSGYRYALRFEPRPDPDDEVVELRGVTFFIHPKSRAHLAGATIDWVSGLHFEGFKFIVPGGGGSCGCGSP